MTARLGNVLYWLASGIAVLLGLSGAAGFFVLPNDAAGFSLIGAAFVAALLAYLAGRAARYVLSGS